MYECAEKEEEREKASKYEREREREWVRDRIYKGVIKYLQTDGTSALCRTVEKNVIRNVSFQKSTNDHVLLHVFYSEM